MTTTSVPDFSTQKTARLAGFFYLAYFVSSVAANYFGNFVFAAAPSTLNTILHHEQLFRVGFIISLFSVLFLLLAAWALYALLKPVNRNLALLFLALNLAGCVIWCLSVLNLVGADLFVSGAGYLNVFQPEQLQAQALVFINLFKYGSIVAQVPYGVWLLPLGYLVYKSRFLPKLLGVLLIADCFGLLIYVVQRFLLPGYDVWSYPCLMISFVAELSLSLWLIVKGVKEQKNR